MQKVMRSKRLAVLGKKTTTCMQGSQPWKDTFEKSFKLLKEYARKHSFVCLNAAFRSDLMWWHLFLEIGMMDNSVDCSTSINLRTYVRVTLAVELGGGLSVCNYHGRSQKSGQLLPRRWF